MPVNKPASASDPNPLAVCESHSRRDDGAGRNDEQLPKRVREADTGGASNGEVTTLSTIRGREIDLKASVGDVAPRLAFRWSKRHLIRPRSGERSYVIASDKRTVAGLVPGTPIDHDAPT